MKTFKDLKFLPHSLSEQGLSRHSNAKQAEMEFENGYGISVIFGSCFYSNGIDTYEIAVLYNGSITYSSGIADDVVGYLTARQVTSYMKKIQKL